MFKLQRRAELPLFNSKLGKEAEMGQFVKPRDPTVPSSIRGFQQLGREDARKLQTGLLTSRADFDPPPQSALSGQCGLRALGCCPRLCWSCPDKRLPRNSCPQRSRRHAARVVRGTRWRRFCCPSRRYLAHIIHSLTGGNWQHGRCKPGRERGKLNNREVRGLMSRTDGS
jgi:hypothetical protein